MAMGELRPVGAQGVRKVDVLWMLERRVGIVDSLFVLLFRPVDRPDDVQYFVLLLVTLVDVLLVLGEKFGETVRVVVLPILEQCRCE